MNAASSTQPRVDWRPAIELALIVVCVPLACSLLLGFGRLAVVAFAIVSVALQLTAGATYGPGVWKSLDWRASVLRMALVAIVFWPGLYLVWHMAGTSSRNSIGGGVALGLVVYMVGSAWALRDPQRSLWAWPLATAAAFAVPLLLMAGNTTVVQAFGHRSAVDLSTTAGRVRGHDGIEVGQAIAAGAPGSHVIVVGAPDPGLEAGTVTVLPAAAVTGGQPVPVASVGAAHGRGYDIVGSPGDETGYSVAVVGDQNGDGIPDILVGAPNAQRGSGPIAGAVYVVYGQHSNGDVSLTRIGNGHGGGYEIEGATLGDATGWTVADAGDVNHDGIADIAIGAPELRPDGTMQRQGVAYIVFGGANHGRVDLARLNRPDGPHGYRIVGLDTGTAGWALADAGDVNGDGTPDLALGTPDTGIYEKFATGAAWIVFGHRSPGTIHLADIGKRDNRLGIRLDGQRHYENWGWSVAGLGDVNGDHLADIAVGSPLVTENGRGGAGVVDVVYGQRQPGTIALGLIGTRGDRHGWRIDGAQGRFCNGAPCGDATGTAVASAGDQNGDGVPDILMGAPSASTSGRQLSGAAFVVYGQTTKHVVDLADVGLPGDHSGYRIDGAGASDHAGEVVASAGDLNGDRRPDVLVGAPQRSTLAGAAYVVLDPIGTRTRLVTR